MTQEQVLPLVLGVQSGRGEYFTQIYEAFFDKLYRYVYSKTHHKETSEDIVSQTFFKAWDNISHYQAEKGPFSAWIYKIAGNAVIDHYRTHKNFQHMQNIDDAWDISSSENVERDADMKLRIEKLESFIQELSTEQRDIVLMRLWQDLSFQEIAEISGKTEGSCKMAYKRALEKIRLQAPFLLLLLFLKPF